MFIDFVSFVICNLFSIVNTNLLCNIIPLFFGMFLVNFQKKFLLFQFLVHCDHFVMNYFICLNHLFIVMLNWKK